MGWILLGSLMFIFAALVGMFPKNLPKKEKKIEADTEKCDNKTKTFSSQSESDSKSDASTDSKFWASILQKQFKANYYCFIRFFDSFEAFVNKQIDHVQQYVLRFLYYRWIRYDLIKVIKLVT